MYTVQRLKFQKKLSSNKLRLQPEVELMLCAWLTLFKYWARWSDLSSTPCPNYVWGARPKGDRTSGWIHSHGMNKNFASAQSQIRGGIFKPLRSPGIDSASLFSLAGRCDNSIRSLVPLDCSKITEQLYRLYWEEKNKNMNADVCTLHPHWFYVDGSMVPGYKFWCFTV